MSIIVPHYQTNLQRHSSLPYLWRVRCSCGWYALAPSRYLALKALEEHQAEEDPFPDLFEEFGVEPEPGSHADAIRKSKGEV